MAVSVTLAPALIAIFGGLLFRPGPARLRRADIGRDGADARELRVPGAGRRWPDSGRAWRQVRRHPPVAFVIAAACLAGLLVAALGVTGIRLGSPLIRELPANAEAARAEAAASRGFVPGILAPADVLVIGPGVAAADGALARLQRSIAHQPGVAGVVGPANLPPLLRPASLMIASERQRG